MTLEAWRALAILRGFTVKSDSVETELLRLHAYNAEGVLWGYYDGPSGWYCLYDNAFDKILVESHPQWPTQPGSPSPA